MPEPDLGVGNSGQIAVGPLQNCLVEKPLGLLDMLCRLAV